MTSSFLSISLMKKILSELKDVIFCRGKTEKKKQLRHRKSTTSTHKIVLPHFILLFHSQPLLVSQKSCGIKSSSNKSFFIFFFFSFCYRCVVVVVDKFCQFYFQVVRETIAAIRFLSSPFFKVLKYFAVLIINH